MTPTFSRFAANSILYALLTLGCGSSADSKRTALNDAGDGGNPPATDERDSSAKGGGETAEPDAGVTRTGDAGPAQDAAATSLDAASVDASTLALDASIADGSAGDSAAPTDAAVFLPPGAVAPQGYLRSADSPFAGIGFEYFYLEDFEDGMLNVPGVTNSGGRMSSSFGAGLIDSVDGDDGNPTDNQCIKPVGSCDARWGSGSLTFTFDAAVLAQLPTHAGAVWTDGLGLVGFEAFGPDGEVIYSVEPFSEPGFPGTGVTSSTDEDRFFGAVAPQGISAIRIFNTQGGVEVDHLQYGRAR